MAPNSNRWRITKTDGIVTEETYNMHRASVKLCFRRTFPGMWHYLLILKKLTYKQTCFTLHSLQNTHHSLKFLCSLDYFIGANERCIESFMKIIITPYL